MKAKPCERCNGTGFQMDQQQVGKSMRRLREGAGRTLHEVATAMGVQQAYVSHLELGRRPWTATLINRFKKALK